jgi:hypothetical protein
LTRRIEALSSIKKYVAKIDQPTLYIEESVYSNLGIILTKQSKSLRFVEQNLKFDFKHPTDFENEYVRFRVPQVTLRKKSGSKNGE